MVLPIICIGNSKGIRIPKAILDKYSFHDKVELKLEKDCIILTPRAEPRKGWEAAFSLMHENGDDKLLIEDIFHDENFEKWPK